MLEDKGLIRNIDVPYSCDTMVALGSSTVSGNTLFAKNSDRLPNECQPLVQVKRGKAQGGDGSQLPVHRCASGGGDLCPRRVQTLLVLGLRTRLQRASGRHR